MQECNKESIRGPDKLHQDLILIYSEDRRGFCWCQFGSDQLAQLILVANSPQNINQPPGRRTANEVQRWYIKASMRSKKTQTPRMHVP